MYENFSRRLRGQPHRACHLRPHRISYHRHHAPDHLKGAQQGCRPGMRGSQGDRGRDDPDRSAAEYGRYRRRARRKEPQAGKDRRALERPAGADVGRAPDHLRRRRSSGRKRHLWQPPQGDTGFGQRHGHSGGLPCMAQGASRGNIISFLWLDDLKCPPLRSGQNSGKNIFYCANPGRLRSARIRIFTEGVAVDQRSFSREKEIPKSPQAFRDPKEKA